MKTRLLKYVFFSFLLPILFLSACVKPNPQVVRIAFEELQEGAFYNGSLMFNPSDPSYSHLDKGTLIAFQDITYGWEDRGDDLYIPIIVNKKFGYLYIRDVSQEHIEYEYLVYGADGTIIEREDSVYLNMGEGEASFSSASEDSGFSGVSYHTGVNATHPVIANSCLLSFIHEVPEAVSEEETSSKQEFRRVVFRIQQPGMTQTSRYPKGVLAISTSSPKSHVVNSSFYHRITNGETDAEDEMVFLKTDNLPEFWPGDFVLDGKYGVVKMVESVDDSDPSRIVLNTVETALEDALGTVIIEIEGDLAEILTKYSDPADLIDPQSIRAEMLKKEWDVEIVDDEEISAKIKNTFKLYVDVSISFHDSVDKFSSSGRISFPMSLASLLSIDGIVGFENDDSYKLAEPSVEFSVYGIPVKVSVPLYFFYDVAATLAELKFEFGPELNLELGFNYDVGAEVEYEYKIIPKGVHSWGHASGIFSHSEGIDLDYEYDTCPNLTSEVGFKAYPGVTIACVLRPEMEIPFALRGSLENNILDLDLLVEGHMEMKLDVKFYDHTWKFGRVFKHTRQLYEKEL
ncbi:hypothetical protein [uncultured Mesotoga sp.]|uniref:hypothetical protein n=1 Tax=uncultured Mesotoga sp. TaxID=1184400 RepID=UPI00259570E6|nr:hypothetical protein [uncultured Mesotoga sp.]